jgi:DNA-binding transcriptional LysR family regulator
VQASRSFSSARLRIAATPTAAGYYLGPFWKAVRRRYPGLRFELSVQNSRRVKERLLALEDDLGMLGGMPEHPDLVFHPLAEDPLVVIVAPEHPWAQRRRIDLAAVAGEPLILREPGSATRDLVEQRLRRAGIEPRIAVEIGSTEAVKQAVEAGAGIGFLSVQSVRRDVRGGHLRAIALDHGDLTLRLFLAHHRERGQSPLLRAVLDALPRTSRHARPTRSGRAGIRRRFGTDES